MDSKKGYYNYGFFLLMVLLLEIHHRYRKWHCYDAYAEPHIIMCVEEFAERVENGQQLVVLDDLVLDVSRYKRYHPGGQFTIQQCIGRDVSKFFYGGYSLENKNRTTYSYNHSNIARLVVN
jgi:hypothetical protein